MKFSEYLKSILKEKIFHPQYIFILDTLLCNSDKFVYHYVFENMGLVNYKIIDDIALVRSHLTEDNIIILNWSSSCNYVYLNNREIVCTPLNINIVNHLPKKYILLAGDTPVSNRLKLPIYKFEEQDKVIFNYM